MVDRRHRYAASADPCLRLTGRRASAGRRTLPRRNADRRRARRDLQPGAAAALRSKQRADRPALSRYPYDRTRLFPPNRLFSPQHLVILRRDAWERDKWIARRLTDAFTRCNDQFAAAQRQFPYVSPWLDAEIEETEALMGVDFHPYGFEKNRATIDIFCRQAYELGIVSRLITAEEYFTEYLRSASL